MLTVMRGSLLYNIHTHCYTHRGLSEGSLIAAPTTSKVSQEFSGQVAGPAKITRRQTQIQYKHKQKTLQIQIQRETQMQIQRETQLQLQRETQIQM